MKKIISILFILTQSVVAFASAVSFTAKVSSNTMEVGQRIQVTFTVNENASNFRAPSFNDFGMLSGPNQSQSMQYVNGNVSRTTSISYVLQAVKEGTFTIGAASIVVDGKKYQTQPFKVKVVAASQNSANAQRNRQNQRNAAADQLKDQVFIRATVDKTKVVVGEKVSATFKLYSKLNLTGINLENLPSLNGFWSQDLQSIYDEISLSREQIDGQVYQVAELQQTILYPQRSGDLTIDPLKIKASVQVKSGRRRSAIEQFFGGGYETKELIVASRPINIKVSALPLKGKPTNFSGAVGKFNMSLKASKDSIRANEAIDIKVTIDGQGNLPLIGAPKLNFPPDFEVYDPETADNFKTTYGGSKGSKVFSYLVIPRHSGRFKLEPYEFTYFDIESKSYKTLQSKPLSIKVGKGIDGGGNVVYAPSRKEEVELLNTDIRYIHTSDLMLVSVGNLFYGSALFYSLIAIAIMLMVVLFIVSKKFKEKQNNFSALRKSKAKKLAKRRLAKAEKHLKTSDLRSFYEEISTALYGYFGDKFDISIAELSQEKIIELLGADDDTEAIRTEVKKVLEEAEMARFAANSNVNAQALYDEAALIISKTESLKR
ncbi:MAG: BatD family protein [Vicingaceae bacterium]